ncbi:MAG: DivIVA domain-containing protein [Balneolaceae bacterium]|nr:DivIVA domain-containing protein [Balneolaceae bacterium]
MKLTALEIKQQKFEKGLRGYDTDEVQAFLGLVSNEWENLVARNRELDRKVEKLEEKLKHYEKVEQALHETLQTAKDSADHKMENARREARNTLEKAEMEADAIVNEATRTRREVRHDILRLLDRRREIIGGIRSYLELARESLDHFDRDEAGLFETPRVGGKEQDESEETSGEGSTRGDNGSTREVPDEDRGSDSDGEGQDAGTGELDDIIDELD